MLLSVGEIYCVCFYTISTPKTVKRFQRERFFYFFQKEYAEPLDWIAKALRDMTFPFITSKYFYEDADAFDADEKKLMAQGVAAFGGIAPTYRIALLDKPTIVWDFHSLLIGLQMMFSFMMAEDKTPLRMCDSCDTIFVANRKNQRYCCDKCRRKGE